MIVWINGTFGVGKTQVAHELRRRLPGSIVSDPEQLGFGIQRMYPGPLRTDFQESPWWASLVVEILSDLSRRHDGPVIVPMTLADDARYSRVMDGLRSAGCEVSTVTLLADRATIMRRIRGRFERATGWAGRHVDQLSHVLSGPLYAPHIDTTRLSFSEVVDETARVVHLDVLPADHNRIRSTVRRVGVQIRHIRVG